MIKLAITMMMAFAVILSAKAQKELVGEWKFEKQESISGKLYSNGSPVSVKISLKGDMFTFDKGSAGADGTIAVLSETLSAGGKPFETVTASKRKKVVLLKKDGDRYVQSATLYNATDAAKIDRKVTDTWQVKDGKLVLERKDENLVNGETWESRAFYTKAQ